MPLYINYPSWIKPEIFPNVPVLGLVRWYGLMYIFAFGTAMAVLNCVKKIRARSGFAVAFAVFAILMAVMAVLCYIKL